MRPLERAAALDALALTLPEHAATLTAAADTIRHLLSIVALVMKKKGPQE